MKGDHKNLMKELEEHFADVFRQSPDGVYLWLDESNMICNEQLAKLFGYSVKDMTSKKQFLETFVAPKDQEKFSKNYHTSIAPLSSPVRFTFAGVKKDGSTFAAETDMIPISYKGHAIAYHFVRKAKK